MLAPHSPWEKDALECIEQHGKNDYQAYDDGEDVH
jgi:hypothetical protein